MKQKYLFFRKGYGPHFRRVPKHVRHLDNRGMVRITTHCTDDVAANVVVKELNHQAEMYWATAKTARPKDVSKVID